MSKQEKPERLAPWILIGILVLGGLGIYLRNPSSNSVAFIWGCAVFLIIMEIGWGNR